MADYKENAIEFYTGDDRATVSFTQGRYVSRIRNLAEKYPEECKIVADNSELSIVAHIPVKWVRIQPNLGREMSEEEREEQRKRMMELRASGKIKGNGR